MIVATLVMARSVGSVVAAESDTNVRPQQGNTAPANPYAPKDYRYKPGQFTPGSNRYDDLPDYPSNSPSPYQPQQQYAPQQGYPRQPDAFGDGPGNPFRGSVSPGGPNQGPGQIPERRPPASGSTGRDGPPPGRWAPVPYQAHGRGQGDGSGIQVPSQRPEMSTFQEMWSKSQGRSSTGPSGMRGPGQIPERRPPASGNTGRGMNPPMPYRGAPLPGGVVLERGQGDGGGNQIPSQRPELSTFQEMWSKSLGGRSSTGSSGMSGPPGQIPAQRSPAGQTGRGMRGPPKGSRDASASQIPARRPPAGNTARGGPMRGDTGPLKWMERGQGEGGANQIPRGGPPAGGNAGRGGPPKQSRSQPGRFSVGGSKAVPIPVPRPQLEKLDPSDKKRATRARGVPMGTGGGPNLTPTIKPIP